MALKKKISPESSTEEKIKEAARTVFTKNGYAATRTRDIAEEAGINLALLNYYFRSKEKLFEIIMFENFQKLFGIMMPVFMDPSTKLEKKIELIAMNYISMLSENPELPIFVLNELNRNPEFLSKNIPVNDLMNKSSFVKQLKEKRPDLNPVHLIINIISMAVFPFVMRPVLGVISGDTGKDFTSLMEERKKLIPVWVKAILKAK